MIVDVKRRNVVVWLIIACLFILAIAIPVTFGGGVGLDIIPSEIEKKPGSTITYDITLSSYDSDCFYITIIPDSCNKGWFEWTEKKNVCVAARGKTQISLDVTPTEKGKFQFRVKAESKSNTRTNAIDIARINTMPPPTPTPTPTPTAAPTCIGLMPDLSEPQKIMTEDGTKEITWTAFACDPDGDTMWYRFCLIGPGTEGEVCTDWSTSNEWTWSATISDEGYNTIYADVRDGKHNPDYDSSCEYLDYQITVNQPPYCACLIPDKFSPQYAGAQITWTACALDAEGDQDTLWYRFLLKGQKTGGVWAIQRDWSTDNTWTWIPYQTSGYYDYEIEVWVRDNFIPPLSKDPNYYDVRATFKGYKIKSY